MRYALRIGSLIIVTVMMLAVKSTPTEGISPVDIFNQTWGMFDTNYPYFSVRGIDWDLIYRLYRPRITEQTTDAELYQVLCEMLGVLNDGHINLSDGQSHFNAGITNSMKMDDFSEELVRTKYLDGKFSALQDSNLIFGWLDDGIGYIRIRRWKQKYEVGAVMDTILAQLNSAKGIVVDVRANTGGNAFAAEAIANRFADQKRLFGRCYPKRGPGHDSLYPARYMYIEPVGPLQYTVPIVILQHRFSESATEEFLLAMRVLPHVVSIGDFTSGCFGMYYVDKLDNGWEIGMPWSYDVDQNGRCWAGIGLQPDLRVRSSSAAISSERDPVLEYAIDLINRGEHFSKAVPNDTGELRESLFRRFVNEAGTGGVDAAIADFKRTRDDHPDKFYFSPQECMNGAEVLLRSGRLEELIAIAKLANEEWPDAIAFPWMLGMVYRKEGELDKAAEAYQLIADKDAYFPWDRSFVNEARQFLKGGE